MSGFTLLGLANWNKIMIFLAGLAFFNPLYPYKFKSYKNNSESVNTKKLVLKI